MPMTLDDLMTTQDVARELHVTPGRVRQFVANGRLTPAKKVGQVLFFERDQVAKFNAIPRITGRPKTEE